MTIEIPYKNQILYFHPAMLIPGFGMVSVAFIFYFFWRKKGISNQYFYWGALTWIIGIALKIAASGLTIKPITALLNTLFPQFLSKSLGWLVVGLYTGIFECIPIYLILRMQRFKKITWSQSVGFGIGFGAIEALLIGIFSLGTISMLLAPEMLPQELAKGFMDFQGINIKTIIALLLPISERLFTVFIHILSCLWIVVAILKGNIKWFLFWLWFTLRGVKFFGNTKRLKIGAGAFVIGLIPVINALPEFTVGIILTIRDVRKEDRVKLASVEQ